MDLLLIASLSAIGLAIKPILHPMIHTLSSTLRIPGGSLSGGFYMMWMVLARVIVDKPGSAFLFGLSQGLTVMLLGYFGSHGAFSIVSYTMPGVIMEVFAMIWGLARLDNIKNSQNKGNLSQMCVYCVVANVTGTLLVATFIMQLPVLLLAISLLTAVFSGMLGGWFAEMVYIKLVKYGIVASRNRR
jgi:energy-coupling factor transport system substrate-specific component